MLASDLSTLRWLTTVSRKHNSARWEILSDANFFLRVQYSTPSSRKSWKHHWDLAYRNRSWRTINIFYHEWTKSWSSQWALPVENICKTLTKTSKSCCKNSYVFRTRHIALFQRALKLYACSVLPTKEVAKKVAYRLFDPNLLENWPYNPQWKIQNQFIVVSFTCRQNISKICKRDF